MGGPPWRMMRGMGWGMGRGMGWRIALSIFFFFGLIAFIIIWLFFFADGFSLSQNIAIFFLALLVFGGIEAAVWATMWMRWPPEASDGKYCSDCGILNYSGARFCNSCGNEFSR